MCGGLALQEKAAVFDTELPPHDIDQESLCQYGDFGAG